MEGKGMTLSYAAAVKNCLHSETQTKPKPKPKSWYSQIEDFENDNMSRSNSMSTILSDDTVAQSIRSHTGRHCSSHSMDSGQISDMSSDNESSSKSTHAAQMTDLEDVIGDQGVQYHRRASVTSVDSCQTSSSMLTSTTYCSNLNCSSNSDQLQQLMCRRWQQIKKESKIETDEGVLARRQKQIEYGKSTIGYEVYKKQVPIEKRTKDHPQTPNMRLKYSRRAFDGLVKIWRKQLHKYDPASMECSSDDQQKSDDDDDNDDDDTSEDLSSDL